MRQTQKHYSLYLKRKVIKMPDVAHLEFVSGTYDIKDELARDEITIINEKIENILHGELTGSLCGRTFNNYIPGVSSESSSAQQHPLQLL